VILCFICDFEEFVYDLMYRKFILFDSGSSFDSLGSSILKKFHLFL